MCGISYIFCSTFAETLHEFYDILNNPPQTIFHVVLMEKLLNGILFWFNFFLQTIIQLVIQKNSG